MALLADQGDSALFSARLRQRWLGHLAQSMHDADALHLESKGSVHMPPGYKESLIVLDNAGTLTSDSGHTCPLPPEQAAEAMQTARSPVYGDFAAGQLLQQFTTFKLIYSSQVSEAMQPACL